MPKKTSPTPIDATRVALSAKPSRAPQAKTSSAPVLKRPVPAASVAKAKKAFKSFSLSRIAGNVRSSNYVAVGQSPTKVQQRVISQHIENLNNGDAPARGMTIALPDATIKKLLPSFNAK